MKEDIYLVRWLRGSKFSTKHIFFNKCCIILYITQYFPCFQKSPARNFDVEQARLMLLKNLKWREENRMDTILQEDFSDLESEMKYWINAVAYDGKPSN
jgi:hypothetical protein